MEKHPPQVLEHLPSLKINIDTIAILEMEIHFATTVIFDISLKVPGW